MKPVLICALAGAVAALLPKTAWLFIAIAALALVFALGCWAAFHIARGAINAYRAEKIDTK